MKKKIILLLTLLAAFLVTACGAREATGRDFDPAVVAVNRTAGQTVEPEEEPEAEPEADPEAEPEADPEAEPEADPESDPEADPEADPESDFLPEDGSYTSKEEVALYIHQYGHLPENFITKREAESLGWPGGNLEPYAPGKCIGGNRFGNYEGRLPEKKGRSYTECDIDTLGKRSRGAKRLVFSNDGLIYYTEDHYETFELLYGEE